ncbi:hypothetical protein HYW75_06265, partial [Candidatus Pacearchaeota archaeon]|nr:hypothetical protein [Candidatus Pacearchaeota archaeon]
VVVVVVLIIGFTQGFDFIFGKFKLLPGQSLQTVVESCNVAANLDLKADLCEQFKKIKIDSSDEYLNCQDDRIKRNMKEELQGKVDSNCGSIEYEKAQCESLIKALANDKDNKKNCSKLPKVNGKSCLLDIKPANTVDCK